MGTVPYLHSRAMIKLTRYQWTVFFAAWLGWGFDIFDGLLFNFVAPNAIPTLLGLPIGGPEAKRGAAVLDRHPELAAAARLGGGRRDLRPHLRPLRPQARADAHDAALRARHRLLRVRHRDVAADHLCRIVASLGIGGEWAAGSAMVAEVVPEESRVEAGALLYTSAPFGLFLATFVNAEVAGDWFAHDPAMSWRYVLLFGLLPAAVAFVVRMFVHEPERWTAAAATAAPARVREIFAPGMRARTVSALIVTFVALITWWTCNAFIQALANTSRGRGSRHARARRRRHRGAQAELDQARHASASTGAACIGTLLTIPLAKYARPPHACTPSTSPARPRRCSPPSGSISPSETRLYMYFFIGLTVFGVFGSFTFYLPELFPTRLRSTGSGFCYNIGRVVTAGGVFAVGAIANAAKGDPADHPAHAVHDRLRAARRACCCCTGSSRPAARRCPTDDPRPRAQKLAASSAANVRCV